MACISVKIVKCGFGKCPGYPAPFGRSTEWKRDNGRRSLVNGGTREAFSPFGRPTGRKRDNGRRGLVNENATVYRSNGRISAG
ncbi:hypothetical protein OROMI_024925 [Orobanche minor]